MSPNLKFINTFDTNPYKNLALEEYMFNNITDNEIILYLWQNRHTVVIGKNQNAFKECKVSLLESDEGFLARRPSGGGAVYHDLGNLNFTFIATDKNYDLDKQLGVIVQAVRSFGVTAEKTGRNDICVDERKFSGNAFLKNAAKRYHHGTILIDVDMSKLSKYLNVDTKKLQSKGVESVKSRVVNLKELNNEINIENMRKALVSAFEEVYGGKASEITIDEMNKNDISELVHKYESNEWRFGSEMKAGFEISERFPWGGISINLQISGDNITGAKVYSDAMEVDFAPIMEKSLINSRFTKESLSKSLEKIPPEVFPYKEDLVKLIDLQQI